MTRGVRIERLIIGPPRPGPARSPVLREPVLGIGTPRLPRKVVLSYSVRNRPAAAAGDHHGGPFLERLGIVREQEVEAVARAGLEPFVQVVGDRLRRADDQRGGRLADAPRELANGEVLGAREIDLRFEEAVRAALVVDHVAQLLERRQRPIEIQFRDQQADGARRDLVRKQGLPRPGSASRSSQRRRGFLLGAADDREEARHDHDVGLRPGHFGSPAS